MNFKTKEEIQEQLTYLDETRKFDEEEEYVHPVKEPQVIDKLKEKDPSNKETKRAKYAEGAEEYDTKSVASPEAKTETKVKTDEQK